MDDETWENVVKLAVPVIRKIKVRNVACVLPILFTIYLTIHLCTYRLSAEDMSFPLVVGISHI